jgi:hypothetical protein
MPQILNFSKLHVFDEFSKTSEERKFEFIFPNFFYSKKFIKNKKKIYFFVFMFQKRQYAQKGPPQDPL